MGAEVRQGLKHTGRAVGRAESRAKGDSQDRSRGLKHTLPKNSLGSPMTIASVRIYYYPVDERREQILTRTHWGFAEWFERRLKPIREQLRGPEAKGVNIVNLMLRENPDHAPQPSQWLKRLNTFEFNFVCDLQPLEAAAPLDNIAKLLPFYAAIASQAPWPQVRALAAPLEQPLDGEDRRTLSPFLQWPRGPGGEGCLGRLLGGRSAV